jgi:hypothetical protein
MRTKTILISLAFVLLITSQSMSQTPARESFNYSFTTLAGLGTASNGFGGPWVVDPSDNGVEGLIAISGTRFNYGDLSYDVAHDTVHLQVVKSNAWSDHQRYKRPLAASWPNTAGKHYWVSYLLDVNEPLPVGNTYFMVKLYEGSNERIAIGKGGGENSPTFTCGSGWPGASGDDVSATPVAAGPVWLVVRIDMNGSTTDPQRTYMWVDPNPTGGDPDTSTAIVKRNSTFPNGFDMIALEFGGDGADVRLVFDEICIAPSFAGLLTGVPSMPGGVPTQFALSQNYPNPFNPSTNIQYTLQSSGKVRLAVYDLLGREVAVLVNGAQNAGTHEVTFSRPGLGSGVYFYTLQTASGVSTRKMVLLK